MFNFGERTTGEKIVMIAAGALTVANTTMNVVNTFGGKRRKNDISKLQAELGITPEKPVKKAKKKLGK